MKPDFSKSIHIDIWITRPGAYAYKIEYEPLPSWNPLSEYPAEPSKKAVPWHILVNEKETTEEHYFSVEPALEINGKDLPLAGLAIQSVVGKWIGPLTVWPEFLKVFAGKGYNMIHFTPLNHRGDSNSPYSIYNQLAFAPDLFEPGTTIEDQHLQMSEMTAKMEKEYGLLSLTDVVWNHTAENSDWLQDHPEAAYNLHNSPHLIAAYQLDTALLDFSSNLRHLGFPTTLNSVDDLLKIMEGIKTHVLGGLRLWEFYILDVITLASNALNHWKSGSYNEQEFSKYELSTMSLQEKAKLLSGLALRDADYLGDRYKKTLHLGYCASYLFRLFGKYKETNAIDAQKELSKVMNEINLPFYKEFDSDRESILENTFNRVKYVRLELKKGEINEKYCHQFVSLIVVHLSLRPSSRVFRTTKEP